MSRRLADCSTAITGPMERFFARLGRSDADRPGLTIGLVLVFVALCCAGFANWELESRGEKLWVPQDSQAFDDRDFVESIFPKSSRLASVIMLPKSSTSSLFTKTAVLAAFRVHQRVLDVVARAEGFRSQFPGQYRLDYPLAADGTQDSTGISDDERLCELRGSVCNMQTILAAFAYNQTLVESFADDSELLAHVNDPDNQVYPDGSTIDFSKLVGEMETDPTTGDILPSGKAFRFQYFLKSNQIFDDGTGRNVDPPGEGWELKFVDDVLKEKDAYLRVTGFSQKALSEEFSRAIGGDILLLTIGYFLIIGYTAAALGRCDNVNSKVAMSFAAVITVGLAIAASFGLSAGLGFFYGPVHSVLPFILLAIGCDDSFIIVTSVMNTYRAHAAKETPDRVSIADRVSRGLAHSGVSITITSVTDLCAFAVGSSTKLPALSSFCAYAAIGICFVFFFQVTFFTAWLSLDLHRSHKSKRDCCCCMTVQDPVPVGGRGLTDSASSAGDERDPGCCRAGFVHYNMRNRLGKLVTNRTAQPILALLFIGWACFSIWAATQLKQDFSFTRFIPDDSYLQDFFEWDDDYFKTGTRVGVYTKRVDYGVTTTHVRMDELYDKLNTSSLLEPRVTSWFESYKDSEGGAVPTGSSFFTGVDTYLDNDGSRFVQDVVFEDSDTPTNGIVATRLSVTIRREEIESALDQVDAMDGLRATVEGVPVLRAVAYAQNFLFWEQFKVIREELVRNVALSLTAVFFITLFLLANPVAAFLTSLAVSMTLIDLLGLMWLWNVDIDSVAVINLVLSLGLAVDYSAHVAHAVMWAKGTRAERVLHALGDVGGSVMNGAISTFLAVLMLAFANSYVFRIFFKMFFGIAIFGVLHGMVFLPVMLCWFAPPPHTSQFEEDVEAEPKDTSSSQRDIELAPQGDGTEN